MAKDKSFKATLKRGASYTLPGVGVFLRGESKIVSEEQAQKLLGTQAFDVNEVKGKVVEEAPEETSGEEAATEAEASKPKPKGKGKK